MSKKSENIDKIIHNLKVWSSLPLQFPNTRRGMVTKGILECAKIENTIIAFKILYEDYGIMRAGIKFLYKELKKEVESIIKNQMTNSS